MLPAWRNWKLTLAYIFLAAAMAFAAVTIHTEREEAIERLETKLEARIDALERTVADLQDAAAAR